VNLQNGRAIVVRPIQQDSKLRVVQALLELGQIVAQGLQGILTLVFLGEQQPVINIGLGLQEVIEHAQFELQGAFFAQHWGQLFRLVPCTGFGELGLDFLQAFAGFRGVKDAPRAFRTGPAGPVPGS